MSAEKTTALVLKVVDFSETSCVVTLLTRDFGKISALAKGARRARSPFEGALDVLAMCRIVFLRKSVDTLDLLTEAKLMRRFRSASIDLSRLYACLYIVELVKSLTDQSDATPELFDLVCQSIVNIDSGQPVIEHLLRFELCLFELIGQKPTLEQCVSCTKKLSMNSRVAFGTHVGGVLCDGCRVGKRGVVSIQAATLTNMKQLASANTPIEECQLTAGNRGELRGLLDQLMADLLGHRPRMYPYLRQIFKTEQTTQTDS